MKKLDKCDDLPVATRVFHLYVMGLTVDLQGRKNEMFLNCFSCFKQFCVLFELCVDFKLYVAFLHFSLNLLASQYFQLSMLAVRLVQSLLICNF